MLVLSLHEGHNASAEIAYDGKILAAVSEERFCQKKNYMGFPYYSALYCFQEAGVDSKELDQVAMVTRNIDPLVIRIQRSTDFSTREHVRQQYEYFSRLHAGEDEVTVRREYARSCPNHSHPDFYNFSKFGDYTTQSKDSERFLAIRQNAVKQHLGISQDRIKFVDHHTCHAAYAYCASSFRDRSVLVFTADCIGDGASATVWVVDEHGHSKQLQRTSHQILGYIWRYVTLNLGMTPLEHEHKVMGLAPYGHRYKRSVKSIFDSIETVQGVEWSQPSVFGHYFDICRRLEGFRFDQIAAGLQAHTEGILSDWIKTWVDRTGVRSIVFSGGLALNVKANSYLAKQNWLENFHVPPGGSDESLPLGACYLLSMKNVSDWRSCSPLINSYLGPSFGNSDVNKAVEKCRDSQYQILPAHPETVAKLLAKGKTIGRCYGRMEFGPRALGNRSILACANNPTIVKILNEQVKQRDWWMPFAPIVRFRNASQLFDIQKNLDGSFMTLCFETNPISQKMLSAACHPMDGSARAQILKRDINLELDNILTTYEKLTGHQALVNTSFNLHGEPIVLGPEQAVDTFLRSSLDALLFPDILIVRGEDGSSLV